MINRALIKIFGNEFSFDCVAYVNLNPVWPKKKQSDMEM